MTDKYNNTFGYDSKTETWMLLKDVITASERVLWSGKPDASVIFEKLDYLFIPLGIGYTWVCTSWCVGVTEKVVELYLDTRFANPANWLSLLFPLIGAVLILSGLYLTIGRFVYKTYKRKRTFYALTDKRVIIVHATGEKKVTSAEYRIIDSIQKVATAEARGTVVFSLSSEMFDPEHNKDNIPEYFVFADLPDYELVYNLAEPYLKSQK